MEILDSGTAQRIGHRGLREAIELAARGIPISALIVVAGRVGGMDAVGLDKGGDGLKGVRQETAHTVAGGTAAIGRFPVVEVGGGPVGDIDPATDPVGHANEQIREWPGAQFHHEKAAGGTLRIFGGHPVGQTVAINVEQGGPRRLDAGQLIIDRLSLVANRTIVLPVEGRAKACPVVELNHPVGVGRRTRITEQAIYQSVRVDIPESEFGTIGKIVNAGGGAPAAGQTIERINSGPRDGALEAVTIVQLDNVVRLVLGCVDTAGKGIGPKHHPVWQSIAIDVEQPGISAVQPGPIEIVGLALTSILAKDVGAGEAAAGVELDDVKVVGLIPLAHHAVREPIPVHVDHPDETVVFDRPEISHLPVRIGAEQLIHHIGPFHGRCEVGTAVQFRDEIAVVRSHDV